VAQLMLFPETPAAVFACARSAPAPAVPEVTTAPECQAGPSEAERIAAMGPGARKTANRLLRAAGPIFTATGFHAASVDQVATAAGVGRGTFYKYFDDKLDLLGMLSEYGAGRMEVLAAALLETIAERPAPPLEGWLAEFLAFHATFAGVWRVWTDDPALRDRLPESGVRARAAWDRALTALVGTGGGVHPLSPAARAAMLSGLLQRFPDQAIGTRFELAAGHKAPVVAQLIDRAFLNAADE
jgi:AcrR family transcriptional regulator